MTRLTAAALSIVAAEFENEISKNPRANRNKTPAREAAEASESEKCVPLFYSKRQQNIIKPCPRD